MLMASSQRGACGCGVSGAICAPCHPAQFGRSGGLRLKRVEGGAPMPRPHPSTRGAAPPPLALGVSVTSITTPLTTARMPCATVSTPTSTSRCSHTATGAAHRGQLGRVQRLAVPTEACNRHGRRTITRCHATSLSSLPPPRQEEDDEQHAKLPGLRMIESVCDTVAAYYWLWIILGTAVALTHPAIFAGMTSSSYSIGLFCIMISMGFTISRSDFQQALCKPLPVLTGMALQFTIMPTCGWLVSTVLGLPPALAVGLILVSCCPGGAASNVVTHVARGNVTLSVVLTSCSTILACVLTPLLVMLLAGSLVPVNAASMGGDVLKVVLLPVTAGMLLAEVLPATIKRYLSSIMPAAAVLTSTCLTSAALGSCASLIMGSGSTAMQPLLAVVLTHAFGFLLGYQLSKRLRFDPETNRTVSIEVGMQSSVMALALAAKHFSDVSSQLPCALSAVVMNVMGAGLAFFFRWRVRQSTLAALRRRTDAAE